MYVERKEDRPHFYRTVRDEKSTKEIKIYISKENKNSKLISTEETWRHFNKYATIWNENEKSLQI